jgi:hypothetical protein
LRSISLLLQFHRAKLDALHDPEQALIHLAADALAFLGRQLLERSVGRHLAKQLAPDWRQIYLDAG